MNKKGILLKALGFLCLTAAGYLEFCVTYAFFRAVWGGFGGIGMVYTLAGQIIECIAVFLLPLLLLSILLIRMILHFRRKAAVKYYIFDVLFCIVAVGLGYAAFYFFREPGETIMNAIVHVIYENGWVEYPVPG